MTLVQSLVLFATSDCSYRRYHMGYARSTHRGGPTDHPHLRLVVEPAEEVEDRVRECLDQMGTTPEEVLAALELGDRYLKLRLGFHKAGFSRKWHSMLKRHLEMVKTKDADKRGA